MDCEQKLDEVITAYLKAVEAGTPIDQSEWLKRYPELADDLAEFFAGQRSVDRVAAPLRNVPPSPPWGEGPGVRGGADVPTLPPSSQVGKPVGPETIARDTEPMPDGESPIQPGDKVHYFGDYELLDKIAQGGMGVVYKARQVSLNRVVALKMILAGQLASETDVRRFRAEAEAAANLDHSNLLPIYEVGEHQGQHYFSMKLITGGSLADRMTELRADPRTGVALLIQVARAVHFAHQRGVLHRDLKPGNVLLDAGSDFQSDLSAAKNDGPARRTYVPYVADFGLAKRVESDSRLTASGAIVGTPSYMPPEQARAEKALTVAVDVYAVGAILYELLTGRPPFRGASQLDTLMLVQEEEPEAPRQLNPAASRDLETVCLKCLAKEPAARYASASDLADDLERWLAGEAVSANPPTRAERLGRWGQRNPVQLTLIVAMLIGVTSAAFVPMSTEGPLPRGILIAGFLTAFFTYMMLLGRSQTKALEKRLRRENSGASVEVEAVTAVPAPNADMTARSDLLRALGRGARNGAFLGIGVAISFVGVFLEVEIIWIRWQGAWMDFNPWPAIIALVAAIALGAVLAGAAGAVLTRVLIRPLGRLAWWEGWFVAGIAVAAGTSGVWQLLLSYVKWWQFLLLVIAPATAVCMDLWTRNHRRIIQRAAAAGQTSPESALILKAMVPVTDLVVKKLPVLLLGAGVVAGHFVGLAVAGSIFPMAAPVAADFSALVGRVAGALVGALLAVGVLRLYRVAEGAIWPGQGDRRYPYALAVLYLSTTAALAAVCFL